MFSQTAACDSIYSADDPLDGQPYRMLQLLGAGSMGEVFLAEHRELGTPCVVKVQRARLTRDPSIAERIRAQVEALARLNDANIVSIIDSGQTLDERPFIVMEYLRGQTMADELAARGQLPMLEALSYTCQLLRALASAHSVGIVHRDIKPDNLFLCDGPRANRVLKLLDFGVTSTMAEVLPLGPNPLAIQTATGAVASALRYVSPEAALERPVDHRSDLYSAALVLYYALAGRGPFDHIQGPLLVLSAQVAEEPEPPSRFSNAHIPPDLDRAVLRALRKAPEDRFQSANELREELERIMNQLGRTPSAPDVCVTEVRSSPKASERAAKLVAPTGPLRIGARFLDKYEIREQIGRGGQAWVYHGQHIFTGREVAIKIVHSPRGMTDETLERGKAEARALGRLDHPNIVVMHDAGVTDDGLFYIVMELLRGRSLRAALAAHGRFNVEEVLQLAIQAAEALEEAHGMGLIHRDLTPDNIYLTRDNRVKVVDFGIAKMLNEIGFTTHKDIVMGSILYMSPEQVQGLPLTTRSDICALGLVMFEALIGKHPSLLLFEQDLQTRGEPHRRATPTDIPPIQVNRMPPMASELDPNIPLQLAQIVHRAIAKNPEARFATMADFVSAMRVCQASFSQEAPITPRQVGERDLSQRAAGESEDAPLSQRATPRCGLVWDGAGSLTPVPTCGELEVTTAMSALTATRASSRFRSGRAVLRSAAWLRSGIIGACVLSAALVSLGALRQFGTSDPVATPAPVERRTATDTATPVNAMIASLSPALPLIPPEVEQAMVPPPEAEPSRPADTAHAVSPSAQSAPASRSSTATVRVTRMPPTANVSAKSLTKIADGSRSTDSPSSPESSRKRLNGGKLIYGD